MTEQAKVPAIRFAGFTDPWEQRKLGEIVSIGAGAPPSAFSAGNFLYVKVDDLNESSHFQFDSAQRVDANTAVKPIRKGSIIFAKRGAAILGNKVRVLGKTAYIDTNMMALEPRGVDADFLWLFINQTGLYRIADTSTIPQINNKHIEPYPVDIPNMAEQQAIGTFFSRLDDLITLHQRKYDKLCTVKKSMLDKMFPKPGETEPEIRFKGFTDPWEQRKFSELYVINNERNESCEFGYDKTLSVATMTYNGGNGAADNSLSTYKVVRVGDIAFEGHTNKEHAYGRFVLNDAGDGLMSPRFSCLRPIVEQRYSFWKHYIPRESMMRPVLVNATKSGTMMNELVPADLMRESILVPVLYEQEAIGRFFKQLDDLITLHQ